MSGTWHCVTGWHCKTMYSLKCQEHDTVSLGDTARQRTLLNVRNPSHPWRTQTCTQPDNHRQWNALCTGTFIMSTNTATSSLLRDSRPLLLPLAVLQYLLRDSRPLLLPLAVLQYFIIHFHKLLGPLNYNTVPETARQEDNSSRIEGHRPASHLSEQDLDWYIQHKQNFIDRNH